MSKMHKTQPRPAAAPQKKKGHPKISLAPRPEPVAESLTNSTEPASPAIPPGAAQAHTGATMTVTLTRSKNPRKDTRVVIFDGPLHAVQFLATAFPKDASGQRVIPETLTVEGAFAEPQAPKAKETPEERKARLAAMPKLTPEQKLAKAKERLARLEAKVAAAASGAPAV